MFIGAQLLYNVVLVSAGQHVSQPHTHIVVAVQSLRAGAAHQASLALTISWRLLKLLSIDSVMPSNHLLLCRPLLLIYPLIFGLPSHLDHNRALSRIP